MGGEYPDTGYHRERDLNMALNDDEVTAIEFEVREGIGDSPSTQVDPETIDLSKDRGPAIRMIDDVELPK